MLFLIDCFVALLVLHINHLKTIFALIFYTQTLLSGWKIQLNLYFDVYNSKMFLNECLFIWFNGISNYSLYTAVLAPELTAMGFHIGHNSHHWSTL